MPHPRVRPTRIVLRGASHRSLCTRRPHRHRPRHPAVPVPPHEPAPPRLAHHEEGQRRFHPPPPRTCADRAADSDCAKVRLRRPPTAAAKTHSRGVPAGSTASISGPSAQGPPTCSRGSAPRPPTPLRGDPAGSICEVVARAIARYGDRECRRERGRCQMSSSSPSRRSPKRSSTTGIRVPSRSDHPGVRHRDHDLPDDAARRLARRPGRGHDRARPAVIGAV